MDLPKSHQWGVFHHGNYLNSRLSSKLDKGCATAPGWRCQCELVTVCTVVHNCTFLSSNICSCPKYLQPDTVLMPLEWWACRESAAFPSLCRALPPPVETTARIWMVGLSRALHPLKEKQTLLTRMVNLFSLTAFCKWQPLPWVFLSSVSI